MSSLAVLLLASCLGGLQQKPEPADPTELARLAEQLGHPFFAVRQSAMRGLWEQGQNALPVLQRYAQNDDAEIASRASRILEHIRLGILPDMPDDVAHAIYSFHKGDIEQKFEIADRLYSSEDHLLALDLLAAVADPDQRSELVRQIYHDGEDVARRLVGRPQQADSWALLDQVMDHPLMWEFHPGDCAVYTKLRGSLDEKIAQVRQAVETQGAGRDRQRLIWLLRAAGRQDEAISIASKLPSAPEAIKGLSTELGRWGELADVLIAESDLSNPALTERAICLYWSNDDVRYKQVLEILRQRIDEPQSLNALVSIHLAALNVDWVLANADKLEPAFAFQMLCYMHRFREAFEVAKVGDTPQARKRWFARQMDEMKKQIARFENRTDRSELNKAQQLFQLCRQVAFYVGMLGNSEESIELHRMMISAIEHQGDYVQGWNEDLFQQLVDLEIGADIWPFFAVLKMESGVPQSARELFPDAWEQAVAWNEALQEGIPDPVMRHRFISNLTRSPNADPQVAYDIDDLLSQARRYFRRVPDALRARRLVGLAQTMRIHQRGSLATDLLKESGFSGSPLGFEMLGQNAIRSSNWREAATWYEHAYQLEPSTTFLYARGVAEEAMGDEQGPFHQTTACVRALHSFDLAFLAQDAFDLKQDGAVDLLETFLHTDRLGNHEEYYLPERLGVWLQDRDAERSLHYWRRAMHSYLMYANLVGGPSLQLHYLASQTHLAQARVMFQQGDMTGTMRLLRRLCEFVSGDTEVAEEFVPLFEEAGQSDYADELFHLVADRFSKILTQFPESAMHYNNYAWVCARCNRRLAEGLEHARRAVELKPTNTSYLDTLAEIHFRMGQVDEAVRLSQQCIALNPYKEHYRNQLNRFRSELSKPPR